MTEDLNRSVSEDTGTEVEGAEALTGQANVVVARPEPGQTVEISAEPGQTYVLDFDPSQARALVDGDNLILVFDDGSRIVFENLVNLAQLEDGVGLEYAGQDMIALLQAQGVILGVLDVFDLITPEPGQIIIIKAVLGQHFVIKFDPALAQLTVDGDDLVMTFPGSPPGKIVIEDLAKLVEDSNEPTFDIDGNKIPGSTLISFTSTPSTDEGTSPTLDTAAGDDEPVGTGATQPEEFGEPAPDPLDKQGVIPPVEGGSGLTDLDPGGDEGSSGTVEEPAPLPPGPPVANDDFDMVLEGGRGEIGGNITTGNVLTGIDPDILGTPSDPTDDGNQVADSEGDTGPITITSVQHDGITYTLDGGSIAQSGSSTSGNSSFGGFDARTSVLGINTALDGS